jgi:hypothetical protein
MITFSFPLRAQRGLERTLQKCHLHQAPYWAASLLSPYVAFASDLTKAQVLTTALDLLAAFRVRGLLPLVGNIPDRSMRLMTPYCCQANKKRRPLGVTEQASSVFSKPPLNSLVSVREMSQNFFKFLSEHPLTRTFIFDNQIKRNYKILCNQEKH